MVTVFVLASPASPVRVPGVIVMEAQPSRRLAGAMMCVVVFKVSVVSCSSYFSLIELPFFLCSRVI